MPANTEHGDETVLPITAQDWEIQAINMLGSDTLTFSMEEN